MNVIGNRFWLFDILACMCVFVCVYAPQPKIQLSVLLTFSKNKNQNILIGRDYAAHLKARQCGNSALHPTNLAFK